MRTAIVSLMFVTALGAVEASAQPVNLTRRYRCVVRCQPGFTGYPAYITQNGWAVNLVNEAGVPGRGWMDWVRIWVPAYNQGAVFSPDGMTVQFDGGTIWRRDLGGPVRRRARR
ncbi:MAG: hypothetical protein ACXWVA_07480 [Rhodoplanes sp.]